jgi:hypothetical protein
MRDVSSALPRTRRSIESMIQAGLRTQAMILAWRMQGSEKWQMRRPQPVGVEHHLGVVRPAIIALEQRRENAPRRASSISIANSLPEPMALRAAMTSPPSPLDMPAVKRGFWRKIPASSVDPERGKPEMK